MDRYASLEMLETLGPVRVLEYTIEKHAMLRPTAIMLPLSQFPELTQLWNLPVIRGDRVALLYEPRRIG